MGRLQKLVNAPASMLIDYPCERRCQVEIDLQEVNARVMLNQLTASASEAHEAAHEAEPQRHFRYDNTVLVRADMTAVTA